MSKIDLFTGPNMGGITRLYYCSKHDIQSMSDPDAQSRVTVTFKAGCSWNEIVTTQETVSFEDKSLRGASGTYYEKQLSFFIPKDREDVQVHLSGLCHALLICRYKDANGKYKIIGDLDFPQRFEFHLEVPSLVKDLNGVYGVFSGVGVNPSYFDTNQS